MTARDYSNAFADVWAAQGQAFLNAQQQASEAITNGMRVLASGTLPAMAANSTDLSAAAADLARADQSMTALWSAATALAGTLGTISTVGATSGDSAVEATFRNMIDPRQWTAGVGEMDEALARMAEGPRFADLWEIERLYARVLRAWMTLRRCGLEHNAVVLEAWLKAGRQFGNQLTGQTKAAGQQPDAKALLTLWTEIANRQLLETQHAEPFLRTQAALIRATTELRMAQQELVEHFGNQYGFPTRTELDDVHRTVTGLRREMRAMRREQRIAAHVRTPPAAAERPPLTRRPATKKKVPGQ